MIQWDELSGTEQEKLIDAAKGMSAATGFSEFGCLGDLLRVINAEVARASMIPAHLFADDPEKAQSVPFRFKWR